MIFFDIGSNQGIFTLIASHNENFVEIHSFEPNEHVFELLRQNLEYNNCRRVSLHNKAISEVDGRIGFSFEMDHTGAGKIDVSANNLSVASVNYCYINEILNSLDYPIFVKVDVEGAEFEVLSQLGRLSKFSNIKSIFVELNEIYSDVPILLAFLHEHGFKQVYKKQTSKNCDGYFVRD